MKAILYTPRGSGHRAPDEGRGYRGPADLMGAFQEWLKGVADYPHCMFEAGADERLYELACSLLPDIGGTDAEAITSLLEVVDRNDMRIRPSGLFLTAAYNKSGLTELAIRCGMGFELGEPLPIDYLGYRLGSGKKMIVRGKPGGFLGEKSKGKIVCYTRIPVEIGPSLGGIIINYGNTGEMTKNFMDGGFLARHQTIEGESPREDITINCSRMGAMIGPDGTEVSGAISGMGWGKIKRKSERHERIERFLEDFKNGISPSKSDREIFDFMEGVDVEETLYSFMG